MSKRTPTELVNPDVPSPPSAESTPPTGSEPTIAELLDAAAHIDGAAAVRAAQESLAPAMAIARRGLPLYQRYAAEAAPLLKRAKVLDPARLGALGCPAGLLIALQMYRDQVAGIPDAIRQAEAGLDRERTLTPAQCLRTPGEASINQWPSPVEHTRRLLMATGAGEDRLSTDCNALREYLTRVERWVYGHLAQHGPIPPLVAKEAIRESPLRTELDFNAMKTP